MAPRTVGGSNYDNPHANPVSSDLFGDKIFEGFDQQEIKDDPIAEVKAEFQEAQRRQREPRPRKGVEL